jgi:hypothetical protein
LPRRGTRSTNSRSSSVPRAPPAKADARHLGLFALDVADPLWAAARVRSGLSSGEGVIYHVRDAVHGIDRKTGKEIVVDAGVTDKRLLVLETEFSQALKMFRRDGNVLSDVLRNAWDGAEVLSTLTRTNPLVATGGHISLIGHVTPEDLRAHLTDLDVANGVANRLLILAVRRLHLVAAPERLPQELRRRFGERTRAALEYARALGEMRRTSEAHELWASVYPTLSTETPGLQGALLARAPAHVMRLATLLTLCAHKTHVDAESLQAALAWWKYVVQSVQIIFADRTGNAEADRIKSEMLVGQKLSLKEIREQIFANHVSAGRLKDGLDLLRQLGFIVLDTEQTPGRTRMVVRRINPSSRGSEAS